MALSRTDAIKKLSLFCNSNEYPVLDTNELGQLIDEHQRTITWTANTLYIINTEIEPAVRNGRKYTCVVAGTSGASAPNFPDFGYTGQQFSDGNDIIWQDTGAAFNEIYDVRAAIRQAFILKASKISHLIDTEDGQNKLKMSALKDSFLKMAEKYRPMDIL